MTPDARGVLARAACRILITGRVQGVGFRPTVARLASADALAGVVENTAAGVWVEVEGAAGAVAAFPERLRTALPPLARVREMTVVPVDVTGRTGFRIQVTRTTGPLGVKVPADVRVCDECLADVDGTAARRGAYPFVSCTNCGPRYSIIERMPYERDATSMRRFPQCEVCAEEYGHIGDRRFHAQTNACRRCGPRVRLIAAEGVELVESTSDDARWLTVTRQALARGQIVALQGLGGFQLLVDARDEAAVRRLRELKRRPAKPLAVLVRDLAAAERLARLSDDERRLLTGPEGPIVVAPVRSDSRLAPSVHPGLDEIGILLPTTPLHALLAAELGPLVATSSNSDGDPLEFQADASTMSALADLQVLHDRPIVRPVDDSVVRRMAGRPVTIRLARGFAPYPLELEAFATAHHRASRGEGAGVVALGGHQKAAFALWNGEQSVLGPHIGDLDQEATRERYVEQLRASWELYGGRPAVVAHDLHPEYFTTALAQHWETAVRHEGGKTPRTFAVQHHHAHVVTGMLEHGLLDQTVLGVAWDGTGYGPDGTIWGGEFLVSDVHSYRRVGRLRPFRLPGGERAVREPWRVALAILADTLGDVDEAIGQLRLEVAARAMAPLLTRGVASPWTTSAGRLFDAAATLILAPELTGHGVAQFEGQLAMLLEAVCADAADAAEYPLPVTATPEGLLELDWRPLFQALLNDRRRGATPAGMAARFHATLAAGIDAVAASFPELPVVLGGGVFQNRRLLERVNDRFSATRRWLGLPGVLPPNDGGLAAGQLVVALATDSDPAEIT